jgi:hypothetical protein
MYTVTGDDETIESVALGAHSLWRGSGGVEAHREANARLMYDQRSRLFKGMRIILPIAPCLGQSGSAVDGEFDCYQVGVHFTNGTVGVETIDDIAQKFETTAELLRTDITNAQSIGAGELGLAEGMMLRVPALDREPPSEHRAPATCTPKKGWSCYTVVAGDSVQAIAFNHGLHPSKVCDDTGKPDAWNHLRNCSVIDIGQQLVLPSSGQELCKPIPGVYDCYTLPRGTGPYARSPIQFDEVLFGGWTQGAGQMMYELNYFVSSNSMVWPGMSVKVPLRRCLPTRDYDCIDTSRVYPDNVFWEYFNEATLKYVSDNSDWQGVGTAGPVRKWPMTSVATAQFHHCDPGLDEGGYSCGANDPSQSYCPRCLETDNADFCYKVHINDTIYDLGARFGVDPDALCEMNQMKNCSCLSSEGSWLKIKLL